MPQSRSVAHWVVFCSLALAMILRILPLPPTVFFYNPDWVLLFLIYWTMAVPERVGVGYAWCAGLFVDVLTGRMLGQHALAYSVVAFLAVKWHRPLRLYPLYQQILSVLLLSLLSQLLVFWTQDIKAASAIGFSYWLPSLVGAVVWPVILLALRHVRRRYRIV